MSFRACFRILKSQIAASKLHVPKIQKFVRVSFICTKIAKNSAYPLRYVPKWCIIGT